jgi:hypothetical protein
MNIFICDVKVEGNSMVMCSCNGGGAKSAKRNKKGDPKRKLALEYIVKLINDLPSHIKCEWLTADELLHLLIVGGIPLGADSVKDVSCIQRRSCRRH